MPTIYAHFHLGELALPVLSREHREVIEANRDCFDLALQGPDVFFYYLGYPSRDPVHFGSDLHRMYFADIVQAIVKAREEASGKKGHQAFTDAELAYLYGFAGHFTLDASAHPYINGEAGEDLPFHFAMETAFDEALLREQAIVPWMYKYTQCLPAGKDVQNAASAVFAAWHERVSPKQIKRAVRRMSAIRRLMYTPTQRKAKMLIRLMKALGLYQHFGTMLVLPDSPEPDEASKERTDRIWRCYEAALERYPDVLFGVDRLIAGGTVPDYFRRDFE